MTLFHMCSYVAHHLLQLFSMIFSFETVLLMFLLCLYMFVLMHCITFQHDLCFPISDNEVCMSCNVINE